MTKHLLFLTLLLPVTSHTSDATEHYFLALKGSYEHLRGNHKAATAAYNALKTSHTIPSPSLDRARVQLSFDRGRFDEVCAAAPLIDPHKAEDKTVSLLLGQAYLFTGDVMHAHTVFKALHAVHPHDDRIHYFLILSLIKQDELEDAHAETERALQAHQKSNRTFLFHFLQAKILHQQNKLVPALTSIAQALKQNPNFAKGILLHAAIASQLGNYESAKKSYERYYDMTKDASALDALLALCKKHNDTDAIRQLIKTHKQGTPLYFYHCAYDAFQSKKYDQAHKYLALVLAKNPQHEQAHQLAIRMHLLQKNTSAALHGYQRWLSADPNNKELILTIMNLRKGKVPPRFVQTIIRSCAQKSPTLWICFALADLLYEQQDYKEARHWYEKARQSIGNGMSPLLASKLDYQIASTWHGQKQFDNARLATEKALQQKVVYPSAYNLYALTLIAGNHSMTKAHEAIDKALMASPYNPAYLDTRGLIYCTQKQWTKACTVFDTALQYSPGNPVIVRHLRMAQSALIPE